MRIYQRMIREVLAYGTRKENRTGVDTLSTFNFNYEICWDKSLYALDDGNVFEPSFSQLMPQHSSPFPALPLLTTKKISWKNIVAEMLWYLSGDTSIDVLKKHGCKFWDAWVDHGGFVPSAYGNFWRHFPVVKREPDPDDKFELYPVGGYNDQLAWVLAELRRNPMSRRLVVSAWAPQNAQNSKLPPCHLLFVFNVQMTREGEQRLCLHLTQRSCDLALGVPYNMASYGLLLLLFSHLTGIKPGIFAHTLIDLHIYTAKPNGSMAEHDHIPGLKEQLERTPRTLPRLQIDERIKNLDDVTALIRDGSTQQILSTFQLHEYDPHWPINFKVAV